MCHGKRLILAAAHAWRAVMKYDGSCHCGRITFEVEGDIHDVSDCNCSLCRRRGTLMWFARREALTLKTPEADMATYTFNKHTIQHRFCANCGIYVFDEATDPKSGEPMVVVNVRCLPDLNLSTLKINHFDGASL